MLKLITSDNRREISKEAGINIFESNRGHAATGLTLEIEGITEIAAYFINPLAAEAEEVYYAGLTVSGVRNDTEEAIIFRDPTIRTLEEADIKLKSVIEIYRINPEYFTPY